MNQAALPCIPIGHFTFWGRTFWRWCGVVYGALFATAALCLIVLDWFGVTDVPNEFCQVLIAFALLIWAKRMQDEARRVQSGWVGRTTCLWSTTKSRAGTHEQFAQTCCRGLGILGWACVGIGAVLILLSSLLWILAVVASTQHNELSTGLLTGLIDVFIGLAYVAFGAVAVNCRRILSAPRVNDSATTMGWAAR